MSKRSNSLTRQDTVNVSSPATSVGLPPTPIPVFGNESPATISPMSTALVSPSQIQKPVMQRNVPPFLNKLYNMVCDPASNDLIRWSEDGTSFVVTRQQELANKVLPRFFKHGNFSSFVRQLNMYGFHKVPHLQQGVLLPEGDAEQLEFSNPNFQRDQPDLLLLVTRKKGRDPDEKEQGNVDFQHIMDEITAIKKHQMSISTELKNIQRDNQVLWQETLAARERHQRHQETIDKILRFLASVFSNDKKRTGIPRKRRLLIGDAETDYSQYPVDSDETDEEQQRPAKITRLGSLDLGDVLNENETLKQQQQPSSAVNTATAPAPPPPPTTTLAHADNAAAAATAFTAPTGNEPSMPTFDFSSLTQAQQMQGLQQLLSLAQDNPNMLSQLTGSDAYVGANTTIAPMATATTTTTTAASTAVVPGLDPSLLRGGLEPSTNSKDTHLTTAPSLVDTTKSIESAMKTADSISQDIDQLGVDIEALAQQLGFDPSKHDEELDYVDLDAFLNNYGGQPSSAPPSPNNNEVAALVSTDEISKSSSSTTPTTSGKTS